MLGAAALLGLILGLMYVGSHFLAADKLSRGTTISGVDVGGQTPENAEIALREGLSRRASAPLDVTIDGEPRAIAPAEAGLEVEYQDSVGKAAAVSWAPSSLWNFYFGAGKERDAVVEVDEEKLGAVLDEVAAQVASPATEGAISFKKSEVVVTKPKVGRALDTDAAATAVRAAYLDPDASIDLKLVDAPPDIDQADVDEAVKSFANPAVGGPVTLEFGKNELRLSPDQYVPLLSMKPKDGVLVPVVKERALAALAKDEIGTPGAPEDATVRLVDGQPKVIAAKPGVKFSAPQVAGALLKAAATSDKRTVSVDGTKQKAKFTTEDARDLKVRRKVSSFTTYYPYAAYRNVNIPRAASLVNGTLVKPGETFSLNDVVGERTEANGFTKGFIISNGVFAEDLGGGVSQMATTTYNAMYFAGLQDVEHWPHSFFIDRYPPGREATVAWGSKDLKFKNNTPYGVLIQANVTPATPSTAGVVTVSMWSTKVWDITTSASGRYNPTSPGTQTFDTEDCVPNEGYGGFEIDVTRIFRKAGESTVVKEETKHTTYIPADTVICKPPKP